MRRLSLTQNVEHSMATNPYRIVSDRVVIAMVGLPARGKSYISKAIVRYLNFLGCPARLFNAGNKRRQEGAAGVQANFFNANNFEAKAQRERMAMETLDDLLAWVQEETTAESGCACGIFDATNTTKARREKVRARVAKEQPPVRLLYLESVCEDQDVLENNYRMKLSNDDYKGKDAEAAYRDFKERVRQYERVYEPVDDETECRPYSAGSLRSIASELGMADGGSSPTSDGASPSERARRAIEAIQASEEAAVSAAGEAVAVAAMAGAVEVSDDASAGGDSTSSRRSGVTAGDSVHGSSEHGGSQHDSSQHGGEATNSMTPRRPPPPGCIQLIDAGRKLVTVNCDGHVMEPIKSLLHSIHLGPRCIWISLVGETVNELKGVLGGDSPLSPDGIAYAKGLRAHILEREASPELQVHGRPPPPAMVLSGTLKRNAMMCDVLCERATSTTLPDLLSPGRKKSTSSPPDSGHSGGGTREESSAGADTLRHSDHVSDGSGASAARPRDTGAGAAGGGGEVRRKRIALQLHRLNELCAGRLDALTYEQMREHYPREYAARSANKLHYRYPGAGGESYLDLIQRLDSIILMLEQTRGNVVVVCDRAVCRVLLGYFSSNCDVNMLPHLDVPQGVTELRRSHSGFTITHTKLSLGTVTRMAGPGTEAEGQRPNRLQPTGETPRGAWGKDEYL